VGPDIPFTAGARASFFLPELPGYQAYPGSDLDGMYDYPCSYSPESSECRLTGSTEEIAHICSADPRCKGFVYIPTEIGLTAKPLGILKGGASMEVISPAFLVVNPSTAVYLQEATFNEVVSEGNASSLLGGSGQYTNATDNNNSSSTSNAMIGWMALSVALAILFAGIAIIAVAFAVMAHRRAKVQDKRSSPRSSVILPSVPRFCHLLPLFLLFFSELMLAPSADLSESPGYERFIIKYLNQ